VDRIREICDKHLHGPEAVGLHGAKVPTEVPAQPLAAEPEAAVPHELMERKLLSLLQPEDAEDPPPARRVAPSNTAPTRVHSMAC